MGSLTWRVLGTVATVAAGFVGTKVVDAVWTRGGRDQINPDSPEVPVAQAVAYAALTGVVLATVRTLFTRRAAAYYAKNAGHLPKPMR